MTQLELVFYLCLIIIILLAYGEHRKRTKFSFISQRLPTAYGIPALGASYTWIPETRFFKSFSSYFKKFQTYTYFSWLGSEPFIITADPNFIKIVLSSEQFLNKSDSIYTTIDRGLKNGIVTSKDEKWKHNRKLVGTALTNNVLTSFIPIFNKRANSLIRRLDETANRGEQDVFTMLKRITLRIALETTMGLVVEEGDPMDDILASRFHDLIEKIAQDAMLSVVYLGFLARTPKYHATFKFVKNFVVELLNKKLMSKDLNNNKNVGKRKDIEDIKKTSDIFMQRAFQFYETGQFSLQDVISESQTMIVASFETTSTTLYSALVLLAMHPDVQEKLFEEVMTILPFKDMDVELENLKHVPYLDMIIAETLRLVPSIPFIGRQLNSDFQFNDITLPKEMQVLIPIFNLHRRKDIWGPKANDFNPDNFLSHNVSRRHPYSYIPFSKGTRNCIGWRYAQLALPVILMKLVRNFRFSTSFKYEDLVFTQHLSIRYKKAPLLAFVERT